MKTDEELIAIYGKEVVERTWREAVRKAYPNLPKTRDGKCKNQEK